MAWVVGAKTVIRSLCLVMFLWHLPVFAGASTDSEQTAAIKKMLVDEALLQNLPPSLILAVAKVESDFNPMAISHVGAKGIMQIMPETAVKEFGVSSEALYDPQTNIRVGVRFIKHLLGQYNGKVDIALSHYNGGSGVRISKGTTRIIPSTQSYVKKVQHYALSYQRAGYDRDYKGQLARLSERQQIIGQEGLNTKTSGNNTVEMIEPDDFADERIDVLKDIQLHNLTREAGPRLNASMAVQQKEQRRETKSQADKRRLVLGWEEIFN